MNSVLFDSDVLLDILLAREPFGIDALKVLDLCKRDEVNGYTTAVIIANVYYLASKEHSSKVVRTNISALMHILDIAIIPKDVIQIALNSPFKDFEDAMQNYAAVHNGNITTIITRNVKDYKNSTLEVMTPKDYLMKS